MKLHLAKFCSAFCPPFLFGFSVHHTLPSNCILSRSVKRFHASVCAHQLFDETPCPSKFQLVNNFPSASTSLYGTLNPSHGSERQKILATALKSCARTVNWYLGVQIHGLIVHNGYGDNIILNSALVDFYAKCGIIEDARRVFNGMTQHDQVSWTSIISCYGRSGCINEAVLLFKEMMATHVKPNSFTYVSVISSCAVVKTKMEQVALFHAHVIQLGFDTNSHVASTLIDFYSKCGEIATAASVFNSTVSSDDVLYNTMIYGYSQSLHCEEALKLFSRMRSSDLKPTNYSMSIILNACGSQALLSLGKQVHCLVSKVGSLCNSFVRRALIDMYSKCGSIDEARAIFDQTVEENVVLWTSMLLGYAQHGRTLEGLELFDHLMMERRIVPDHICFTALLTACNHAGLVDKGVDYFNKMSDCGLAPNRDQYACLIDLFARKGHLVEAKQLLEEIPSHTNNVILSSYLSSCKSHGAIKLGIEAANQLTSLQPHDGSTYVTLAQMYAEAGSWDQVAYFKKLMEQKRSRKRDGWSWSQVDRT